MPTPRTLILILCLVVIAAGLTVWAIAATDLLPAALIPLVLVAAILIRRFGRS